MTERRSSFVDRTLRLADGRTLGYAEYGDPDGFPVLHFHGSPSSRLDGQLGHVAALQRRVRLIAPDRPGFGLSDFKPGRSLLDWPDDVTELADQLGLPFFSILAFSGGGPHALACTARIPQRIRDTAIINGFVPDDAGLFQRGLSGWSRLFLHVLPKWAPWALPPLYRWFAGMADRNPQRLLAQIASMVPEEDRDVLSQPEMVETFFDTSHEAFRSGVDGTVWETCMLVRPWGFEPEQIPGRVWLFHGEKNRVVPAGSARRLAQQIPKCTARFLPGYGHAMFPRLVGDALDVLVATEATGAHGNLG